MSSDPETYQSELQCIMTHFSADEKRFDQWNITTFEYVWLACFGYYGASVQRSGIENLGAYIEWYRCDPKPKFGLSGTVLLQVLNFSLRFANDRIVEFETYDQSHVETVGRSYMNFLNQLLVLYGVDWG